MPTSTRNYTSSETLRIIGIAMIAVASVFFISRNVARYYHKGWRFQIEDLWASLAFVFFLAMSVAYIVVIDSVYRLADLENGKTGPYPELIADEDLVTKVFFCTTMLLWFTLWSVKFSFLFLYRRLMTGLSHYLRWWWAILVFCTLTLIGAIISNLLSCASMEEWFGKPGSCISNRDQAAQMASLYYSFAVDVLSDLMIMILPLRLVWNLRVSRREKAGVIATFTIASLCIIAAVVRVVSVGSRAGLSTPSSSWLALWGMVEGCIAIVVVSLPSFAIAIRRSHTARRSSPDNGGSPVMRRTPPIRMNNFGSFSPFSSHHSNRFNYDASAQLSSSQEDIVHKANEIAVTRTTHIKAFDEDIEAGRSGDRHAVGRAY